MLDNFIIKKILKCKKCVRIVAMAVMVCACFYLVYRTHIVFNIEPVYTHFFYIPSLLAVIWWRKKGLIVPIVISVMLLSAMADSLELSHHVINDFFQTMVLISVSIMTLFFIERMDKGVKEKGIFINSLKESEEKFKVLFESSQDALMTLSPPAWKFNSVNKTGTKLFGVSSKEEFLSKAPWEYSPEYQPDGQLSMDKAKKMIEIAMKKGSNFFEWTHKKLNDGDFFATVLLTKCQVKKEVYIQATVRDITEQKKVEKEKEVLQKRILQSQKMEALGSFVGGIAHDFNNLLMPILSISELSKNDLSDKNKMLDNFNEIKKSALRGKKLVTRLLAFSREQPLELKIINLNDLLENIEKLLSPLIGENIELKCILDKNIGNIKVDTGQMEQVILNLASNARDAMPKGGKFIIETSTKSIGKDYAETHKYFEVGKYVLLTVSDIGSGMDKKTIEQIFNPFFTTKEKNKGTGLGLATVYGIVKQLGGNISVYSEVGHGTTFKIYFKQAEGEADKLESNIIQIDANLLKGKETILLVEDDEGVIKVAKRMLKQYGYNLLIASNAQEGKKIFQEHKDIQLLFTDIMLTGFENGRDLAEELKALRPEIKVLFMSGYADGIILNEDALDKSVSFIQKPFGYKDVGIKIRELLDLK